MIRIARMALVLCIVAAVTGPMAAQEKVKGEKGKGKSKKAGENPLLVQAFQLPPEIELNDEQKAKVDELKKKYGQKLAEAAKKQNSILTEEQKAKRKTAAQEIKQSGKRGKEAQEALDEAMGLSEIQKTQMKESQDEIAKLTQEVRKDVYAVLTDEQKTKLPRGYEKGKAKGKGKPAENPKKKKPTEQAK